MQTKVVVALTLIFYWVEAMPVNLDGLDFDNTEVSDLKYDSGDLENYLKFLENEDSKKKVENTLELKKKKTSNNGGKVNYSLEDFKKFFRNIGLKDNGSFDDSEVYGLAEGTALKAVGVKGNENRKYRKGTKTRGFHRVQHKDEYKKDKEFYEDDITSGEINKIGAKGFGYDVSGGIGFDKGQFHHIKNKGIYGKQGYSDKGNSEKDFSDYSNSQENDPYFDSEK